MGSTSDVVVLGSGPAGLSLAAACAEQGLDVACVAPDPEAPWPARYGAWLDELAAAGVPGCTEATWPSVTVHTGRRVHRLARPYARVDGGALQAHLRERAERAGARFVAGVARELVHDRHGSQIRLEDGALRAHLVADATGYASPFVARAGEPAAFQVAWGRLIDVAGGPWEADCAVLMDLRDADPEDPEPPSFLYALPRPDGRVFVEETSLAAAPPMPLERLQARLDTRLHRLGVTVRAEHEVERCRIPLDTPLPARGQRVVAFGGAAAMVHPATGYLLARVLAAAPRVARAIAAHLPGGPDVAAARAAAAVWPLSERSTRALHDLGLRVLLHQDAAKMRAFFQHFFDLPPRHWRRYLSASAGPLAVASAMTSLFVRLGPSGASHLVADLGGLR